MKTKIWIPAVLITASMGYGAAAQAACPSPFTVRDATGAAQNVAEINDVSDNCVFPSAITDGGGAANRAAVKAAVTAAAPADPAVVVALNPTANPCNAVTSSANINLTASGQIIPGTSSKQTYICSVSLIVGAADNVALVEGTGATCGTSTAGMAGGTTAATGWNLAANGGLAFGNGSGVVARTATAADNVCLLASSATQVSGNVMYVQQ